MKFYTNCQVIGNTIHFREIKDGAKRYKKRRYSPSLYVNSKLPDSPYKTITGESLQKVDFEDIREARNWIKEYDGVENFHYYGMTRHQYAFMAERYKGTIKYDINALNIQILDIENESEHSFSDSNNPTERVNLISLQNFHTQHVMVFGLYPYKRVSENTTYVYCKTEEILLEKFLDYWSSDYPDIVTGWWISGYDIPYLVNRITQLLGEEAAKRLSPFKKVKESNFMFKGMKKETYDLLGLAILDYQRLYGKFTSDPRENFKLDYICDLELGIGKVKTEYGTFKDFYNNDWDTFVEYNIQDVRLIKKLDEKCNLLALVLYISYDGKSNFEDIFSQVRVWDCKIYNRLLQFGIQVPQLVRTEKNEKYAGAYVKEPKPGMYSWIIEYDFESLYPNILRTLNIGPDTKITKIPNVNELAFMQKTEKYLSAIELVKEKDHSLSVNGVTYSKVAHSFFSDMIKEMVEARKNCRAKIKEIKANISTDNIQGEEKEKLDTQISELDIKQMALKIQANSLYGAIGNEYFRFYDVDNAEAITVTGRFIIQHVGNELNKYFNTAFKTEGIEYLFYGDTDSCYICLDKMIEIKGKDSFIDANAIADYMNLVSVKKIEPKIEQIVSEVVTQYLNGIPGTLKMARGTISQKGIWTAKKRYALSMLDKEGERYKEPKLKVMGLEIKKAVIPKFCKEIMTDCLKLVMATDTNAPVIAKIKEVKTIFYSKTPEEISMPKKVNGLKKYPIKDGVFKKGTPGHVKSALSYNSYIDQLNLVEKYKKIESGDNIRLLNLKMPNPTKHSTIAFQGELPKEFNLHQYVDYDLQYKKSFLEPFEIILKAIGYTSEVRGNLKKWF